MTSGRAGIKLDIMRAIMKEDAIKEILPLFNSSRLYTDLLCTIVEVNEIILLRIFYKYLAMCYRNTGLSASLQLLFVAFFYFLILDNYNYLFVIIYVEI